MRCRALALSEARSPGRAYNKLNRSPGILGDADKRNVGGMRDFDVYLKRRYRIAAIHSHLNTVTIEDHVLGDRSQDFFPQYAKEVGLATRCPFVRQDYLQPLPRHRSRVPRPEQVENVHAALRPNSFCSKRLRSLGMLIGTSSPISLRAASR